MTSEELRKKIMKRINKINEHIYLENVYKILNDFDKFWEKLLKEKENGKKKGR